MGETQVPTPMVLRIADVVKGLNLVQSAFVCIILLIATAMADQPLFKFGVFADVQYGEREHDIKKSRYFKCVAFYFLTQLYNTSMWLQFIG